jgi:hypothetical protein
LLSGSVFSIFFMQPFTSMTCRFMGGSDPSPLGCFGHASVTGLGWWVVKQALWAVNGFSWTIAMAIFGLPTAKAFRPSALTDLTVMPDWAGGLEGHFRLDAPVLFCIK